MSFETHAYGFVPVDNDAHFETTGGKEWLVTDGYLWTRFVDAMELFDESNGSKGQSMEISDADGYTDDRGRVVFTNATFTGLCILGDDVPPAMTGSTISTVFSKEDFKSTFEEMLAEFSAEKGEYALATKKKQNDEAAVVEEEQKPSSGSTASDTEKPASSATSSASKPAEKSASEDKEEPKTADKPAAPAASDPAKAEDKAATPSETTEEHDDNAEMSVEKGEDEDISLSENESAYSNKEDKDSDETDGDDTPDDEDEDDSDEDKKKFACGGGKKKKAVFELSLSNKEHAFIDAVRAKYGNSYEWIWLEAAYEAYGIVGASQEEFSGAQYFRIDYSVNADDSIKLGDKTEVFPMYVTAEEKNKIESDRVKLSDLEEQIKQLTAYKAGIEMQAKEKSLDEAKGALTADQVKDIKSQFEVKTPEEIEKEIAFALYTTHKEEVMTPSRGGVKAINYSKKDDYGYGSANELFHK